MWYGKYMKQYGLRYLYKHLGKAMKELPFEVTNHNKVIAVVTEPKEEEPKEKQDEAVDSTPRL